MVQTASTNAWKRRQPARVASAKSLARLLLPLLLVLTLSAVAHAQTTTGTTGSGLVWSATNSQVAITGYTSALSGTVSIPSTINVSGTNLPVTSIGSTAFQDCNLTSVTFPNSVTSIGGFAFEGCAHLTSVTIPKSVTSIGASFYNCTGLTAITVDTNNPAYSNSVDGVLFNKNQTTLVEYPSGRVGSYAIPNSVTSIGTYAFLGCKSLTSVTIPASVTSIIMSFPNSCFIGCTNLTAVTVDPSNSVYSSIDGVLFNKKQTTLIEYPGDKAGGYTIPSTTTSIGDGAFYNCSILPSVTIPTSVTSIGWYAFEGCNSLTCVTIPSSVTSIGPSAFAICPSMTSITVDPANPAFSSVDGVLFDKNQTTLLEYPSGRVGSYTIPNSVASIGTSAFSFCESLTSVIIPASVTSIGGSAFYVCSSLKSAFFMGNAPSLGGNAFHLTATFFTAYYFSGATGFDSYPCPTQLNNWFTYTTSGSAVTITAYSGTQDAVSFPSRINGLPVTGIGSGAFSYCSILTSVTIPDTITSIGANAFQNCTGLTSVIIPGNVTSIGNSVFSGCTSLTSVTIPSSVTSIGSSAFSGCSRLTSVTIPSSVTTIGSSAFSGCSSLSSITVDAQNSSYSSVDGVLFDKNQATLIQCPGGKSGSYIIPDTVTSFGANAFYYCTSLTSVTIPSSVTSIGTQAFFYCTSLTSVTIPSSVTSIGTYAFGWCTNLTSVTIPSSVTSIGTQAFYYCSSLTSVTIPNSVTSIGSAAFAYCTRLTGVTIPSSVTSIGSFAFFGCTGLTNVTVANGVASIGSSAFYGCTVLKNAVFMGNAPSMGSSVFGSVASDFTVSYFSDKSGFTSPTWNGYTTVNMGDSSSIIAAWLLSNRLPCDVNLQSVPNRDGVPLLMAYALNLDPTRNQSRSIPQPVVVGNNMSLTYYAASAGITYTVEASPDLKTWSTDGVTRSGPDTNNCYTATVPITGAPCFMRLKVVR